MLSEFRVNELLGACPWLSATKLQSASQNSSSTGAPSVCGTDYKEYTEKRKKVSDFTYHKYIQTDI